jgi:hypothetical protein
VLARLRELGYRQFERAGCSIDPAGVDNDGVVRLVCKAAETAA